MGLKEKADRVNEVFKDKDGFVICKYHIINGKESLMYFFSDKNSAHKFLLEQKINYEGNDSVRVSIEKDNDSKVIETHFNINIKKKEQKIIINQETINKYVASNDEFWDSFYIGSVKAEYSIFKVDQINSKEDFYDSINTDKLVFSLINVLFKQILLKDEFFVAGLETGLILTNFRLIIIGAQSINIPLVRITKYGVEGSYFIVKYIKNETERTITLSTYMDETLVNCVLESSNIKSLNDMQIALIENFNSSDNDIIIPIYEMPPVSDKQKKKSKLEKSIIIILIIIAVLFILLHIPLPGIVGIIIVMIFFSGSNGGSDGT